MTKSHRFFKDAIFASALVSIAFAISCVELGPVPEFEYSYDFDTDLPEVDTASLSAQSVELNGGSVDNSGAENFSSSLNNASEAVGYAQSADGALTPDQEEFWGAQTPSNIRNSLDNGDASMNVAISSGISSFQSNSSLLALIPAAVEATGSLSNGSGRTADVSSSGGRVNDAESIQQENLDDCKQAAQDAFDVAKAELDSILVVRRASVDIRFANQLKVIERMRPPLEEGVLARQNERTEDFLELFNSISATIGVLFGNGAITAEERVQLNIINLIVYAFSYQISLNLVDSEMELIDNLLMQVETNLENGYNSMLNGLTTNFNKELERLAKRRDSTQGSCHDQGGIHDQGGAGPN